MGSVVRVVQAEGRIHDQVHRPSSQIILGVQETTRFAKLQQGRLEFRTRRREGGKLREQAAKPVFLENKPSMPGLLGVTARPGRTLEAPDTTMPRPTARRNFRRLIFPDCLYCSVLIICSFSVVRGRPGSDISSAKCLLEFLRVTAMLVMSSMSVTHQQAGRPHKKKAHANPLCQKRGSMCAFRCGSTLKIEKPSAYASWGASDGCRPKLHRWPFSLRYRRAMLRRTAVECKHFLFLYGHFAPYICCLKTLPTKKILYKSRLIEDGMQI